MKLSRKQRTGEESRRLFKREYENVMKDSGLKFEEIMDYNVGMRVLSVRIDSKKLGRYYFRYGVYVNYTYTDESRSVLCDLEFFKTTEDGILFDYSSYGSDYIDVMHIYLPKLFEMSCFKGLPSYKLLYINSYPPFNDEAIEIINQDTLVDDDYMLIPILSIRAYIVIEFLGTRWILRVKNKCLFAVRQDLFKTTRDDTKTDQFNPAFTIFTRAIEIYNIKI